MNPALLLAISMIFTLNSWGQARKVRVGLFWMHPPSEVKIVSLEPSGARMGQVNRAIAIKKPQGVSAEGDQVRIGRYRAREIHFFRAVRVEGAGFAPFQTANMLTVGAKGGRLRLTVTMPLEEYAATVLAGEAGGFKSDEALKAMAVAARTYAMHFGSRHAVEGFDFCDTTHCQDIRLGTVSDRVRKAVLATEGELLWFDGRPAATYYSRSCGGVLESARVLHPSAEMPYLRERQDEFCVRRDRGEWHGEITKDELRRALLSAGVNVGSLRGPVVAQKRSPSGRVEQVGVASTTMPADQFRLAIGRTLGWDRIRSDLYEVQNEGDRIVFTGRGQGHGIGLCQTGAEVMGEEGKDYRDILAYYYPGTVAGINAQGLLWQALGVDGAEILTTNAPDGEVAAATERTTREAQQLTGWHFGSRPQVRVYPSVAVYRDATGEPGWVAASTRGLVVRLQPAAILRERLVPTLRHEFLHILVESHARINLPLWFREGLVLWFDKPGHPWRANVAMLEHEFRFARDRRQMERAYADARGEVASLIRRYGKETVLNWVQNGLPPDVVLP